MKSRFMFTLILFLTLSTACVFHNESDGRVALSGEFKYEFISYKYDPRYDVKNFHYDFWYYDSCVVMELNHIQIGYKVEDTAVVNNSCYVFLDLRNKLCQKYNNRSDTAKPTIFFRLTSGDFSYWNFFTRKKVVWEGTTIQKLVDTVIDAVRYRRIMRKKPDNGKKFCRIYYISTSDDATSPIRLPAENSLDLRAGERLNYYEDYLDNNLVNLAAIKRVSKNLDKDQIELIQAWKRNESQPTTKIYDDSIANKKLYKLSEE